MFEEYDVVLVKRAPGEKRDMIGTEDIARRPEPGDVGVVLLCLGLGSNGANWYSVECVGDEGATVWLMDLREDEMQRL